MSTPYYSDEFVTLYHGDCREILPTMSGDLVLADPPYAVGLEYDEYDDTQEALASLIRDVHPMMVAAAPVVAVTPGIANVHDWPKPRWILCWRSTNAAGQTGYWGFNEWQPILVYGTDPYLKRGMGRRPDVISVAIGLDAEGRETRALGHPCPKPLPAWKKIMQRLAPVEGLTVIDPFCGAGTSLVAARALGHQAIGVEQSERYCEIAAKRLAQGVLDFGAVS